MPYAPLNVGQLRQQYDSPKSSGLGSGMGKIPKGYDLAQVPKMDTQSMGLRDSLFPGVQSGLGEGLSRLGALASGDESQFSGIENLSFRDFERGLGQIGSRYAGVGSGAMSSRRSSAFNNEVTGAAGDLASKLQAQRLGIQRDALNDLMDLSKMLLSNQPYEYALSPKAKKKDWLSKLVAGGAPIAGAIGGGLLGGPFGASLGAGLGSSFGSAFL